MAGLAIPPFSSVTKKSPAGDHRRGFLFVKNYILPLCRGEVCRLGFL